MNVSKSKAQGKWFIDCLGIVSQESGTLVSTFPFHGTAWISWWLLAVLTGSGTVAEPGTETQSDSTWHLLSILWPERASFPLSSPLCTVGSCGGLTLCAQTRIWGAAQTGAAEGSGNPAHSAHLPPALQRWFAYMMNYLQGFLFYVGRSLCGPFQNSQTGLQNFYLSLLLIDWILYSLMVKPLTCFIFTACKRQSQSGLTVLMRGFNFL